MLNRLSIAIILMPFLSMPLRSQSVVPPGLRLAPVGESASSLAPLSIERKQVAAKSLFKRIVTPAVGAGVVLTVDKPVELGIAWMAWPQGSVSADDGGGQVFFWGNRLWSGERSPLWSVTWVAASATPYLYDCMVDAQPELSLHYSTGVITGRDAFGNVTTVKALQEGDVELSRDGHMLVGIEESDRQQTVYVTAEIDQASARQKFITFRSCEISPVH